MEHGKMHFASPKTKKDYTFPCVSWPKIRPENFFVKTPKTRLTGGFFWIILT